MDVMENLEILCELNTPEIFASSPLYWLLAEPLVLFRSSCPVFVWLIFYGASLYFDEIYYLVSMMKHFLWNSVMLETHFYIY